MKYYQLSCVVILLSLCLACKKKESNPVLGTSIQGLRFIGEQTLPSGHTFDNQGVVGLSGIDYANGIYYIVGRNIATPIHFYTAQLTFDENSFSNIELLSRTKLLNESGESFDDTQESPTAIRFEPASGNLIWISENVGNPPNTGQSIRESSLSGDYVKDLAIPVMFQTATQTEGLRENGIFEGISKSIDGMGYWTLLGLPLKQDGELPVFGKTTKSPVRIAYIDRATGKINRQFAYELDAVSRQSGGLIIHKVTDILAYAENNFLVVERSFSSGYSDGGNHIRIYKVDASNATDVAGLTALKDISYTPVTKTLLFDFEDIRSELSIIPGGTDHFVGNIGGLTFGPDLRNGRKSLVLVSRDGFGFSSQKRPTQFIVFEVTP